jgi:hypothetical protein
MIEESKRGKCKRQRGTEKISEFLIPNQQTHDTSIIREEEGLPLQELSCLKPTVHEMPKENFCCF